MAHRAQGNQNWSVINCSYISCCSSYFSHKKKKERKKKALADVAQQIECRPAKQRLTSSIPSLGHMPGLWPGPQQGACERQPNMDVFLSFSRSKKKINKIFKQMKVTFLYLLLYIDDVCISTFLRNDQGCFSIFVTFLLI